MVDGKVLRIEYKRLLNMIIELEKIDEGTGRSKRIFMTEFLEERNRSKGFLKSISWKGLREYLVLSFFEKKICLYPDKRKINV